MQPNREVRCEHCSAVNRVRRYSFRQIQKCGSCHRSLPENLAVKALRGLYLWSTGFAGLTVFASALLLFAWVGSSPHGPTVQEIIDCTAQTPPPVGDYLVTDFADRLAPFEINTSQGFDYLVKLEQTGRRAVGLTFFVIGGQQFETMVPLGTYTLKYVAGKTWCGRSVLFGNQQAERGRSLLTFDRTGDRYEGQTVTLYPVPDGNFAIATISRPQF
jgi:hypothetical protein